MALKKSEEKASKAITSYMQEQGLVTIGCAMDALIKDGIRVRNSEYTPVRQQYIDELKAICEIQNLSFDFYNEISKAIFCQCFVKAVNNIVNRIQQGSVKIKDQGRFLLLDPLIQNAEVTENADRKESDGS